MTANELRIGNWVYSKLTDTDFTIEAHDIVNISAGFDNGKVQPIEITEEWLVKFGFKPDKDHEAFLVKYSLTLLEHSDWFIVWHNGHALGIKIKYVHQLQNLYHALTKDEL
jgi:hypothetical protein